MEIEAVKKEVARVVKEELARGASSHRAFFFGSRVTGTASATSDLDVGIEGDRPVPLEMLRTIRARCEALHTLFSIDIVDFFGTSDDFKKVAKAQTVNIV